MSLIAWYPLNGDTLDYSGNGNNGSGIASYIDNGKIGKCLNCESGVITISLSESLKKVFSGNKMTLSLWWKQHTTPADWSDIMQYTDIAGIQRRLETSASASYPTNHTYWINIGKGDTTYSGAVVNDYNVVSLGSWVHLVFVREEDNYFVYKNGVKYYTTTTTGDIPVINSNLTLATHNNTKSYINDVRFYDHALSDKEVYDLSKAKILHYTFNDFQEPTSNMISVVGSPLAPTWWSIYINGSNGTAASNAVVSSDMDDDGNMYEVTVSTPNGPSDVQVFKGNFSLEAATSYTLSMYIKATTPCTVGMSMIKNGSPYTGYIPGVGCAVTTVWQKFSTTGSYTTAVTDARIQLYMGDIPAGTTVYFYKPQLEQKDHATPFVEGSRSGEITDCSGYGYNTVLDLATTPKWIEGKIGSGAYDFGLHADNRYFEVSNFPNLTDSFTVSCWTYIKDSGDYDKPIITKSNDSNFWDGWALWDGYGNDMRMSVGNNGTSAIQYISSTNFYLNDWIYIVGRFDGSKIDLFYNGIKSGSGIAYSGTVPVNSAPLRIGRQVRNSYTTFEGYIDDVRIYATALTDQDIKDLYEVRASLDKSGNLYFNQLKYKFPKSALDIQQQYPNAKSGIYTIQPDPNLEPFDTYCDMDTDGGGWTLINNKLVGEIQTNSTTLSYLPNDNLGGISVKFTGLLNSCDTESSVVFINNSLSWSKIRFTEKFYGVASCWGILGSSSYLGGLSPHNLIAFNSSLDVVRDTVRMGGSTGGDAFDGRTSLCDNTTTNFWHSNNGTAERKATIILRRSDLNTRAGIATGAA